MNVMPTRRRILSGILYIVLAGFVSAAAAAEGRMEDADKFLASLSKEAVAKLNDCTLSDEQRQRHFQNLVKSSFDIPKMSKFVLGVTWRKATPEQRAEFVGLFEEANLQRFMPIISRYSDQKFTVNKVRQDPNNPQLSFVGSTIGRPKGAPAALEWRVVGEENEFRILDVKAEGVSMMVMLRQEYGSVVRKSGVDGLIAELHQKIQSGVYEPAKSKACQ